MKVALETSASSCSKGGLIGFCAGTQPTHQSALSRAEGKSQVQHPTGTLPCKAPQHTETPLQSGNAPTSPVLPMLGQQRAQAAPYDTILG